jgi:hypothetical protein
MVLFAVGLAQVRHRSSPTAKHEGPVVHTTESFSYADP